MFASSSNTFGTRVHADDSVGIWGTVECITIPENVRACDFIFQQVPPIRTMGSEYVGVHYRGRLGVDESIPYRFMGVVDGTVLTWEPAPPPGAPSKLDSGEWMDVWTSEPFVVRSQDAVHPFYLGSFMTAGTPFEGHGDPEWVNTVPTGQYLSSYVLFAEPGYGDTNLVVVRSRSEETGAFADVTLDCAGPLGGWKAVGAYEFTRVDLIADGQDVGACAAGRRRLSSSLPFGVTLWAWGSDDTDPPTGWVSYAYAPGAARKLNDVSLPWNPPVE